MLCITDPSSMLYLISSELSTKLVINHTEKKTVFLHEFSLNSYIFYLRAKLKGFFVGVSNVKR